ncbi:MAG: hypothetical protein M1827_003101 [Pycnora praestabilis]|nr:MAG: hypothetical protein M1827_003101 [Pycnora praestabilis]
MSFLPDVITSHAGNIVSGVNGQHDFAAYNRFLNSYILSCQKSSEEYLHAYHNLVKRDTEPFYVATRHQTINSIITSSRPLNRRSLISPSAISYEMTITATAPGSPPELSGSKSSKSSSFHSSSQFSNNDGILSDVANFEDIGLDDEQSSHLVYDEDFNSSGNLTGDRNSHLKRPPPRARMSNIRNPTSTMITQRELTGGARPGFPSLKGQVAATLRDNPALNLPNGGGMRNGFKSPSSPSLAMTIAQKRRSRSPSPNSPITFSQSPRSFQSSTMQLGRDNSSVLHPPSRRGSWQPSRKSTKELEEEYHDSDEEVDEDAVFWNVPITPRPAQERSKSATASASTSPERPGPLSASTIRRLQRFEPPATVLAVTQGITNGKRSKPTSPVKPNMLRGVSMGSIPDHYADNNFSRTRIKSWTAALSDLSEEAKTLTEVLEAHADTQDRLQEEKVQNGASPPRPNLEKHRAKTSIVELPPLRKNDVMIDPLPISKEKEKVLTRTRPSWLPPKCQKEEKKHLREYQRMMAISVAAEKRRAAREQTNQHDRDTTKTSLNRIWDQHVLPDWDRVTREPRTRELWWRGITPRSRGIVWQRAVGNELELKEASYVAALQRAKDKMKALKMAKHDNQRTGKENDWFFAIGRDVKATFPDLRIFQPGGPLNQGLVDVLMAYSMYRSDVGYMHGTHFITALLLLSLAPVEAFIILANLLNRPLPLAFLTHDAGAISRAYNLTLHALKYKLPNLYHHLTAVLQLPPETYLEPMFRTLFTRSLPIDVVSRVWDVYVFEGDSFLVRTAIGLLGKLEGRLYGSRQDVLGVLGWEAKAGYSSVGGEDEFMLEVRSAGKEERKTTGNPSKFA